MRLAYRNAPSLSSFSSVSSFPSLPLWLAILCLASLSPFHPRVGSQAAGGCVGPPSWCVNNCFAHVKFLGSELLLDQFSGWVVRQRHQPRLHAGSGLIRHSKPLSFPLSSTLCTPTVATCLGTLPYHLTCTHPLPVHTPYLYTPHQTNTAGSVARQRTGNPHFQLVLSATWGSRIPPSSVHGHQRMPLAPRLLCINSGRG